MAVPFSGLSSAHSTLVDILCWRALHQPDQLAYTFLQNGDTEELHLTYADLDRRARAIGAKLHSLGMYGERALLVYQPGLEFVAGFFGCLYAGVVAVPVYPPHPSRLDRTLPRFLAIVDNTQPRAALTSSALLSLLEAVFPQTPDLRALLWLATDTIEGKLAEHWHHPALSGSSLAFFQYTSGSTAVPRGVMLTHDNLLHNSALIQQGFESTSETRDLIWLPFYHDAGLIGGLVEPLYCGCMSILMPPLTVLQRPFRWLLAISRMRATCSGGPNFMYDLCVRKITSEQCATLDLSSWDLAFICAEPVRSETMEHFAEMFAACGFRKEAFYPCYGLAEATLITSGGLKAAPPVVFMVQSAALEHNRVVAASKEDDGARTLVGCGQALGDQKIVIAHPDTLTTCLPGEIGEIWISGPSVAQGYWKRAEETDQTFRAHLADTGEGPFLRTGDLGFLRDGELFVTGRLKDLIIIDGVNHYPQDIELTVEESHPAVRPSCCAAFSVEIEGQERLVIMAEVERRYQLKREQPFDVEAVIQSIKRTVGRYHELAVYAVLLLKPGTIPKTSSGKIQRHICRANYLTGSLDVLSGEP
jgi:acyl-CoA synthetase (AMP-forming)/AMP-acid ligase II